MKNKLSTWLLWRPLQFTGIILVGITILSVLYGLLMGLVQSDAFPMWPLWTAVGILFICGIIWLGKKLPTDNLDRRSFIATYTALNIVMFTLYLSTILGALAIIQKMLTAPSIGWGLMIALAVILLVGVYSIALGVTKLYAIYRRIRAMGTPRKTAILSIPFGLCLLAAPAYILPETGRKRKTATDFGSGKYAQIVEWIAYRRGAAFSLVALGLIITTLTMGVNNSATIGWIGLAIFSVWYLFNRTNKRPAIDGAYSTSIAVLNVIFIAIAACVIVYSAIIANNYDATTTIPTNAETIEITSDISAE